MDTLRKNTPTLPGHCQVTLRSLPPVAESVCEKRLSLSWHLGYSFGVRVFSLSLQPVHGAWKGQFSDGDAQTLSTLTFNPLFSLSTISEWLSMSDKETVLGVEQLLWHRDKCNGHPGRKIYVVSVTLGYH